MTKKDAMLVLDIGKTNLKLALIDAAGNTLAERRRPNTILAREPYPHHDTEGIWRWLIAACREFAELAYISAIVPVTHGATAALVDEAGLVLPVLDYEAILGHTDYQAFRPPYTETFSPDLPAGLNLGRQLAWLQQQFPHAFGQARHILMYPQYWAWRLCGVAASEATSLGCHTDLWDPVHQRYSRMVVRMEWDKLMPPMRCAAAPLGEISAEVALATGLPLSCQVICGIHDSNASLVRYLRQASPGDSAPYTVLSTGTWVIAAAFGVGLDGLRENADMLANTNALGQAVASMRFMGGREFGVLAGPQASGQACSADDLIQLLDQETFALPCFAATGGPFAGWVGRIDGPAPSSPQQQYALATLYVVLMTDHCLEALGAGGPIYVEGSFTANPWFGSLLASLRPRQSVIFSSDTSGTTCGGWLLRYPDGTPPGERTTIAPSPIARERLRAYRDRWRAMQQGEAESNIG